MSETATVEAGQEKKAEKETISIKRWIPSEKKFINPVETKAIREEVKGETRWLVRAGEKGFIEPAPGSEITDTTGNVWVVKTVIDINGGPMAGTTRIKCERKTPAKKE